MKTTRRIFLKYTSILGLISIPGFSLFAQTSKIELETIGSTYLDEHFDPDGWL